MEDGKLIADREGRPYAKLSELKVGDVIETDDGFTCMPARANLVMKTGTGALFVVCKDGMHFLDGQADDGEHCIGMYHVVKEGG